jgi:hypothetical protein
LLTYPSLIAVSGVGTKPPDEWTDENGSLWLASIPERIAPEIGLFAFDHPVTKSTVNMWQDLLALGDKLLLELVDLVESQKVLWRPNITYNPRLTRRSCSTVRFF